MLGPPMISRDLVHVDRWGPGPGGVDRWGPGPIGLALIGSMLLLSQCQKKAPEEHVPPTAAAKGASTLPAASATPPASASAQRSPMHETPFAGQDLSAGKWIETSAYKFKVNG